MWSGADVTSCQNDFVTEREKKKQMRTFEINDGLETILFHTLLPPPDEEGRRTGEEREGEGWRWWAGGMGGLEVVGGQRCAVPGRQNFFDFTDNFLCNY